MIPSNYQTFIDKDKNIVFSDATKLTSDVRKLSIRLRRFGSAQKKIQKYSTTLKLAKKKLDVKECEALVKEAQKALKDIDYDKVTKIISNAKKRLQELKAHQLANEKITKIHSLVNKAENMGIDLKQITLMVKKLEKYLEHVKESLKL